MRTAIRSMSTDASTGGWLPHSDCAERNAENGVLKEEIARLKLELEITRRLAGRSENDILMHLAIDALLHQAKELSALVYRHHKQRYDCR